MDISEAASVSGLAANRGVSLCAMLPYGASPHPRNPDLPDDNMSELTQEKRDELIKQIGLISTRLYGTPEGPARDDLKAELRQLARLLWLDGKPAP